MLRTQVIKWITYWKAKDAPTNTRRRVQFDPLALLLDASLEGEIELVKKVIDKVKKYDFLE